MVATPKRNVYLGIHFYTFIDAFAKIGGLVSILTSAGYVIVQYFSHKLLIKSLIGKLYHFRPKFDYEIKKRKSINNSEIKTVVKTKKKTSEIEHLEVDFSIQIQDL